MGSNKKYNKDTFENILEELKRDEADPVKKAVYQYLKQGEPCFERFNWDAKNIEHINYYLGFIKDYINSDDITIKEFNAKVNGVIKYIDSYCQVKGEVDPVYVVSSPPSPAPGEVRDCQPCTSCCVM